MTIQTPSDPQAAPARQPASVAVVRQVAELRAQVGAWRRAGEKVALVPTMGALHEGHLTLVREALRQADRAVVSIFVNPKQFGPHEDFSRYPRQEAEDLAKLSAIGAHLAYMPGVEVMYPEGFASTVHIEGPIVRDLEAAVRPGHFDGVATVVAKLFTQTAPDIAVFGEKDYQQLQLIKRMVHDLDLPLQIVPVPTVRDAHGLALSSRNAYLDERQLAIARQFNVVLREIAADPAELAGGEERLLKAGFDAVDYLVLRDAETLDEPLPGRPRRLLSVARLGPTRLLDNFAVEAG